MQHKTKGLFFLLSSLAVVFVFLSNWSLLDGMPRNSLSKMLSGNADKPFAYRLLLPQLVHHIEPVLPEGVSDLMADTIAPVFHGVFADRLVNRFKYDEPGLRSRATQDWSQKSYRVEYVLTTILMLAALWATLHILSNIASLVGASETERFWAPILFALLLPLSFLNGGYFYDFIEQFFASLLLFSALSGNGLMFVLTAIAGQLNKETMLLMPLFLTPILVHKVGFSRAFLWAGMTSAVCALLYLTIKSQFASNPGLTMENNLATNLAFWSTFNSYTGMADMYAIGLPLPRMSFCLVTLAILILGRNAPRRFIFSNVLALCVLIPIFLVSGYYDEFRSLGLIFPLLFLITVTSRSQSHTPS